MPDIRSLYEKDFLGQWDCTDQDLVLTIKGVKQEEVAQPRTNQKKKKVCLTFQETDKKMVLNATNRDIIAKLLGGLRVRNFLPQKQEQVFCDECGQEIQAANNMTPAQIAAYTKKKYGKALCPECAKKAKEEQDAAKA